MCLTNNTIKRWKIYFGLDRVGLGWTRPPGSKNGLSRVDPSGGQTGAVRVVPQGPKFRSRVGRVHLAALVQTNFCWNGILFQKKFWPPVKKNCRFDQKNFWKFEAKSQVFFGSQEQFIWKIRALFEPELFLNFLL